MTHTPAFPLPCIGCPLLLVLDRDHFHTSDASCTLISNLEKKPSNGRISAQLAHYSHVFPTFASHDRCAHSFRDAFSPSRGMWPTYSPPHVRFPCNCLLPPSHSVRLTHKSPNSRALAHFEFSFLRSGHCLFPPIPTFLSHCFALLIHPTHFSSVPFCTTSILPHPPINRFPASHTHTIVAQVGPLSILPALPTSFRTMISRRFILPLLFLLALPCALAITSVDYKKKFFGEGTYYGYTAAGNCAMRGPLPSMYKGMVPIAMNNKQYGDSDACGACLLVTGFGKGLGGKPIRGTFKAYVHDRCPECKPGDIDLSVSGDGRWDVSWKFIPCPSNNPSFLFEGSNQFYWKIQFRGSVYPIQSAFIAGIKGLRTQDNFFIFQNGGGFRTPVTIKMIDTMGATIAANLKYSKADGPAYPSGFSVGGRSAPPKRPPPTRAPPRSAPKPPARRPTWGWCVPQWKACTGPNHRYKTSTCCSKAFRCVKASQANFLGFRCEPIKKPPVWRPPPSAGRCVPKYKACTGPKNWWRTSRCCGGFRCVVARERTFVGKRCEP